MPSLSKTLPLPVQSYPTYSTNRSMYHFLYNHKNVQEGQRVHDVTDGMTWGQELFARIHSHFWINYDSLIATECLYKILLR